MTLDSRVYDYGKSQLQLGVYIINPNEILFEVAPHVVVVPGWAVVEKKTTAEILGCLVGWAIRVPEKL